MKGIYFKLIFWLKDCPQYPSPYSYRLTARSLVICKGLDDSLYNWLSVYVVRIKVDTMRDIVRLICITKNNYICSVVIVWEGFQKSWLEADMLCLSQWRFHVQKHFILLKASVRLSCLCSLCCCFQVLQILFLVDVSVCKTTIV